MWRGCCSKWDTDKLSRKASSLDDVTKVGIEVLVVHVEVMSADAVITGIDAEVTSADAVVTAIDVDAEVIVFGAVAVRMCATANSWEGVTRSYVRRPIQASMPSVLLYQALWNSSIKESSCPCCSEAVICKITVHMSFFTHGL